jgi:hypothetical protein
MISISHKEARNWVLFGILDYSMRIDYTNVNMKGDTSVGSLLEKVGHPT